MRSHLMRWIIEQWFGVERYQESNHATLDEFRKSRERLESQLERAEETLRGPQMTSESRQTH